MYKHSAYICKVIARQLAVLVMYNSVCSCYGALYGFSANTYLLVEVTVTVPGTLIATLNASENLQS